jgi:SAM-dependent methyltransferase
LIRSFSRLIQYGNARSLASHSGEIHAEPCICGNRSYEVFLDFRRFKVLSCNRCGMKRNYPFPTTGICGEDYQKMNDKQENLHYHQEKLLHSVIRYLKTRKDYHKVSILDIGCSTGKMLGYLRTMGFQNLTGSEMEPFAVRVARSKGFKVISQDIKNIKKRSDAVYLNHVLEHLPDPKTLLKTAYKLLNKGGILGIAVPNIESRFSRRDDWAGYGPDQHFWYFTPASLDGLVSPIGFKRLELFTLSRKWADRLGIKGDNLTAVYRKK